MKKNKIEGLRNWGGRQEREKRTREDGGELERGKLGGKWTEGRWGERRRGGGGGTRAQTD